MQDPFEFLSDSPTLLRIAIILAVAIGAHFAVRGIRWAGERLILHEPVDRSKLLRTQPRVATLTTIIVSALTFAIYFTAIGFVLRELNVNLTTYIASASVIGLAVGFGSQGFVQDVVVGLTLIFSDVLNVGDMVDISGQTGRVERVGLRFTTLTNFLEQSVNVPNRNIAQINRYRRGHVRAFVDVQLPSESDAAAAIERIERLARGMREQFSAIVLAEPEIMGLRGSESGAWTYLRIKFRLWPGQGALIETGFRQRVVATMKAAYPEFADWMVTVTYRAR